MLVRQLIGKYAGITTEMPYDAALKAEATGAVEMLRHGVVTPAIVAENANSAEQKSKRRGGWPRGKPRGSRQTAAESLI